MEKNEIVIITDYSEETLTLQALCEICGISSDFIQELIEYEILHAKSSVPEEFVFDLGEVERIKTVLRLQRDLEVNLAGAAVVLDLLDQVKELRTQMEFIKKHYLR